MRAPNPAGLLIVAACGAPAPSFPAPAAGPTTRIAPTELARSHATSSTHVALPFELDRTGVSGTALVLGFLERASAGGARYVSDVSIVLQVVHAGVPVECVSRIAIDDGHRAPPPPPVAEEPAAEGEYSTTVRPWHPELVTAWVLDRDYVCKKVGHQVVVPTPQYQDPYDAEVPRYIEPGQMPTRRESQIVWTDDCHYEPARRQVTRYGHFVAARFAPVELPRIAAQYSEYKLVEEPPECHQIPAGKMQQRIEGELYFAGELSDTKKIPVPEPVPPPPAPVRR
jgi:hypothetical protein